MTKGKPTEFTGIVSAVSEAGFRYGNDGESTKVIGIDAALEISGLTIDELRQKLQKKVTVCVNEANRVTAIQFAD